MSAAAEPPRLPRRLPLGKRLAFWGVMLALVAGVAELLAFAFAWRLAGIDVVDLRPALARRARAASAARRNPLYKELYDPDLGWVYRQGLNVYGDPRTYDYDDQGARACSRPFADTLVSTYGDSFTHGDGVAGHETWSYRLGEALGTNVLNFGVGGYGTDQAVLRIEKNCQAGLCTPVVALGICSENINRTLGNVRAFYTNDGCVPCVTNGPKPMFRRTAAGWELLPIGRRASLPNFLADVDNARRYDFWYRGVSFPYTLGLARLYLRGRPSTDCGPHCVGRWDLEEARALMIHLLRRFVALSRQYGFHPVAVMIPCCGDFVRLEAKLDPGYRRLFPDVRATPELATLPVVDVLGSSWRPEYRSYTLAHPGPDGHRLIAEAVLPTIAPLVEAARSRP